MKTTTIVSVVLCAGLVVALTSGCSKSTNDMTNELNTDGVRLLTLRLSPANGATGVPTDARIGIKFSTSMDTLSVMSRLYFTGGSSMQMWMDSMNHSGGTSHEAHHGDAGRMMTLMDSLQFPGHFAWNETLDSCTFVPDSLMMPGTSHMIYMDAGMMSGDGMTMEMDKDGASEVMQFHFTTAP